MVMALTASAIISNALFLQSNRHPDPLFSTRPPMARQVPQPVPIVASRPAEPQPEISEMAPPMPRLAPNRHAPAMEAILAESPEATAATPSATETVPDAALVTEIQRELARLGLYRDTIDGLLGAHTQAAIAAYQTAAGLPRTGLATPELLSIMRHPLPARGQPAVADPARDAEAAALDMRERQRAEKIAAEKQAVAETQARANTRIVQSALNRIGYGPLTVDGDASEATADAIRRFELDNGLPITGTPSDALVGRLVAIGAVKSG